MGRTDQASRLISASPDRIFGALSEPKALADWLPPNGMSGRIDEFDFRPGGSYRMVLTYDDPTGAPGKTTADGDVVEARFLEIVPGRRLVTAIDFVSDDPALAGTMTMSWEVAPDTTRAAMSQVTVRADNVPEGIAEEDHAAGMASSLANLARFLEQTAD